MFLVYLELKLLPSENFPLSMYRLAVVLVAPIQLLHRITFYVPYLVLYRVNTCNLKKNIVQSDSTFSLAFFLLFPQVMVRFYGDV